MKRTAQTGSTTKVKRRSEVVSAARAKLSAELMRRYNAGESIRSLADATGRSYGFVYRLLSQEGVLRRRSGTLRRAADDRNESAEDS
ncbi:helix-turn-helix domain-containing protein [Streptomyces qinglanensis]|uniref:helix-turn-helix domain-containing protein n=1 Tax=Streptomyces qinglanensis TaxID=943816 RepID=UPI00094282F3|nr:helix-turn-helix domain-containing protein [Streptomyces qinglanensis]